MHAKARRLCGGMSTNLGVDLRLLEDLSYPSFKGRDLLTVQRPETDATDLQRIGVPNRRDDLVQGVLLRLWTRKGELTPLGHPNYGSRLHELMGKPNDEITRARARLYVLQALAHEPRIAQVKYVQVTAQYGAPHMLSIGIGLITHDLLDTLTIRFPFLLKASSDEQNDPTTATTATTATTTTGAAL